MTTREQILRTEQKNSENKGNYIENKGITAILNDNRCKCLRNANTCRAEKMKRTKFRRQKTSGGCNEGVRVLECNKNNTTDHEFLKFGKELEYLFRIKGQSGIFYVA